MAHAPITHREVSLTPSPASLSHILHIDAAGGSRHSLLRAGSKRTFDDISGHDEESYARKHLATEGNVFFRSTARLPRNILWRVLDNRKVLEIQAVDLVKDAQFMEIDSWLTFRVEFKDAILEKGIQFADSETDALECFVLTAGKELITVTLKRDLLTRPSVPADFDAGTCIKRYTSSFLNTRQPFRFHAASSLELFVSLTDGGLVRLERKANENGAQWRETFFSEGGWKGTLTLPRSFNPFAGRATVNHNGVELDATAIVDLAKSPDGKFVWTVSLDHCLRAWSTTSGKVTARLDLLKGKTPEQNNRNPYLMSAEQGRLLQIVTTPTEADEGSMSRMDEDRDYAIVVHSPKDHQFKIYEIVSEAGATGESVRANDLASIMRLVPPVDELMNTNIWHLEHFYVKPGVDWTDTQFWIRARSGALCKTFSITLDLLDDDRATLDISNLWATAWTTVDIGALTNESLKQCADYPGDLPAGMDGAVTPSERWQCFLFAPGRFTPASLETALYMYRKAHGLSGTGAARGLKATEQPLQKRIASAVTAKVLMYRSASDQPNYIRYQQDLQAQWLAFYAVLSHIHARRHEPLALAVDEATDLAWSVSADFVAPIRACNDLELREANDALLYDDLDANVDPRLFSRVFPDDESVYLSRLLAAAKDFRLELSPETREKVRQTAQRDALRSQSQDEEGRTQALFTTWDLNEDVTDAVFGALNDGVDPLGGLVSLKNDHFEAALEWLDDQTECLRRSEQFSIGRYGADMTVFIAREMVQRAESVLLDVLVVVVFVAGGLEEPLDPDFDADVMYGILMARYRKVQLLLWLLEHQRETTSKIEEHAAITQNVTLLEDVHMSEWQPVDSKHDMDLPRLLTLWTGRWLMSMRLDNVGWSSVTTGILARLVSKGEGELALDFLRFTDRESDWSIYVQARLHLLVGNLARARIDFEEAAGGLAAYKGSDLAELLTAEERPEFGKGKAVYFQHVAARFEKLKEYSYVADFARLALAHTTPMADFRQSMRSVDKRKAVQDSPLEQIDSALEEAKLLKGGDSWNEILNQLFTASLHTGRFTEAFDAVRQLQHTVLKKNALKSLITACVKQDAVPTLLELPFDEGLARETDKVLLDAAKRELESGSASPSTPYYRVLYAFRTQRADFRGAAAILYEHLERLRHSPGHLSERDPEDENLLQCYVLLINTLACCGEEDAWLLAEPIPGVHRLGSRRRLVSLDEVRLQYSRELDHRSELLNGRFPMVGTASGAAMDVDMEVL